MNKPTFKAAQVAFNEAINAKQLRTTPGELYAGNYMYMGTYGTADHFKHRETRQYLIVDHATVGKG